MLEEMIRNVIANRKRYLYAFLGFILGLLIVTIGIYKTIFVIIFTIFGYLLGGNNKKIQHIMKTVKEEMRRD